MSLHTMAEVMRYIAQTGRDGTITLDGALHSALTDIAYAILLLETYEIQAIVRDRARRAPETMPRAEARTRKMSLREQEAFVLNLRHSLILADGRISARAFLRADEGLLTGIETVAHTLDLMAAYGAEREVEKKMSRTRRTG